MWDAPDAAFARPFEDALVGELIRPGSGPFLDLGAGYGRLYPLYGGEGRTSVLADYAPNLLEQAAAEHGDDPGVLFVAANAYHLPFRDGTFSGALSVRTFHHMAHPELYLAELARVLADGAHAVMDYPNKRNAWRIVRHGRRSFRKDHEEYAELLYGTHPAYFEELAGAAGLTVVRTRGTGFLTRLATERTQRAERVLAAAESAVEKVAGTRNLAPRNFVELVRDARAEPLGDGGDGLFACPACGGAVADDAEGMRCAACGRSYPRLGPVLDFRHVGRVPAARG